MRVPEEQIIYLRDKFAAYTGGKATGRVLKTIGMVGAIPNDNYQSGMGEPDKALLEKSLQTLQKLGYTIASDFDVSIININEEYGGMDYMDASNPERFDISIFCYILRIKFESQRTQNDKNNYIKNSPFETRNRHSWLKAALGRETQVIITHGTPGAEVSSRDFKGGGVWNRSPYKLKHSEPFRFHGLNAYPDAKLQVMAHKGLQ